MGQKHSTLVAQTASEDAIIPAGIARWPLTLQLSPDSQDDALAVSYEDVGGQQVVEIVRNHMPHNAVNEEDAGNLPFTGAVPAPAKVTFRDGDGRTAAVLMNGPNGDARSGPQVRDHYELDIAFASMAGYRNGEGRGVLYGVTPRTDPDAFFDGLPSATAEACGLVGEQCPICMGDYEADEVGRAWAGTRPCHPRRSLAHAASASRVRHRSSR